MGGQVQNPPQLQYVFLLVLILGTRRWSNRWCWFFGVAQQRLGAGAFGILRYAGIGASGLGWEIQQEFEDFVDPPATVENISIRGLSSHPSVEAFLLGWFKQYTHLLVGVQ